MCDWQARCWIYSFFVTSFLPISSQVRFATTQSHWIWVNFNRNTSKGSNAVKRVLMTNRATCDVSNSLVWGNCFEVEIKTLRAVECGSFTLYDQRANRFLYIFSNLLAGCKKLFCVSGTSSRKPRKREGLRRRAARASARKGVDSEARQVNQTNPCHAALLFILKVSIGRCLNTLPQQTRSSASRQGFDRAVASRSGPVVRLQLPGGALFAGRGGTAKGRRSADGLQLQLTVSHERHYSGWK